MICPHCETPNRDGAVYCDTCGARLAPGVAGGSERAPPNGTTLLEQGGLVGWMTAEWFLRFVLVAIVGLVMGVITLAQGLYGFSVIGFLLFVVGVAGTWFMARAK